MHILKTLSYVMISLRISIRHNGVDLAINRKTNNFFVLLKI